MTLLNRFSHFGCADCWDRIYAISGLAENCHGSDALVPIESDYSPTAEELYIRLAEVLVNAAYLLWVLHQVCARCGHSGTKGLPS